MNESVGASSSGRIVRGAIVGVATLAGIVAVMMWLMGVFEPKIGDQVDRKSAGRPIGDAQLRAVQRIRVPASEWAVGTVRAVHETSVASKLLAKVVAVRVRAGQAVAKDDVIVELDAAALKARRDQAAAGVDVARAARDQAKTDFDRIEKLAKQNVASQVEQDRATTGLAAAKADLKRAEQQLKEADTVLTYATIRSPMDGVVVDKQVEAGDTARPGQVLVTLYDPTRMQLVARVRESLASRLVVGDTIGVRIDALDLDCRGSISEVVPEADAESRTFAVKVTGPCPPGVYAGMFGRLTIPLDETEVLVVPAEAVRRVGQLDIVDVATAGTLSRRAVRLGRRIEGRVEVLSGLREGERVAVPATAAPAGQGGA